MDIMILVGSRPPSLTLPLKGGGKRFFTRRVLLGGLATVVQATKIQLYVNLKTAKALGINVPLRLSDRADELFE